VGWIVGVIEKQAVPGRIQVPAKKKKKGEKKWGSADRGKKGTNLSSREEKRREIQVKKREVHLSADPNMLGRWREKLLTSRGGGHQLLHKGKREKFL